MATRTWQPPMNENVFGLHRTARISQTQTFSRVWLKIQKYASFWCHFAKQSSHSHRSCFHSRPSLHEYTHLPLPHSATSLLLPARGTIHCNPYPCGQFGRLHPRGNVDDNDNGRCGLQLCGPSDGTKACRVIVFASCCAWQPVHFHFEFCCWTPSMGCADNLFRACRSSSQGVCGTCWELRGIAWRHDACFSATGLELVDATVFRPVKPEWKPEADPNHSDTSFFFQCTRFFRSDNVW